MDDDEDDITVEIYENHETHDEVDEVEHEVLLQQWQTIIDDVDVRDNETMVDLVILNVMDDEVEVVDTVRHDEIIIVVIIAERQVDFEVADTILI